jgi:hypothetical protein
MATFTTTAKYALRWLTGGNLISDVDAGFQALAEDIDASMAGQASGTVGAMPAAGKAGRIYRATDTGEVFLDTGSAWILIAGSVAAIYRPVYGPFYGIVQSSTATGGAPTPGTNYPIPFDRSYIHDANPSNDPAPFVNLSSGFAMPSAPAKFRIVAGIMVGKAPVPARTITVKLVPITVTGGVTNSVPIVLGTPVGSASVDLTTGSDGSVSRQFSVDFNDPGAGEYVLTASVDSAMTANSMVLVSARLEVRNVLP